MRVLVFGASTAQGFWDSEGGWPNRLIKHYQQLQVENTDVEQPRVMNLGVSGDSTTDLLKRLEPEIEARKNDKGLTIIIQIGTNNAAVRNGQPVSSTEIYQADMLELVASARKYSNKILLVGLPSVNEAKTTPVAWADWLVTNDSIAKYEDVMRRVAEQQKLSFVPVHAEFMQVSKNGKNLASHDGLHPNDDGHALIAELVCPKLDLLLKL